MKIDLVGPSYQGRSIPFDAQRTINLFPVIDEKGKEPAALFGTAGLAPFTTVGAGAIRGMFKAGNGRVFCVSGATLYEIERNGSHIERGLLKQSSGFVSMGENFTQMGICDGKTLYIFTYDSNAFSEVADPDFPGASSFASMDSYFIVSKPKSNQFYISNVADGQSWAALDFASAESSPDTLVSVYAALGLLWLFGERTTEIYTNTGASLFPFERMQGIKIEMGVLSPQSIVAVDNSIFWIGQDMNGHGMVYRAQGTTPKRISTDAIDYTIQRAPRPQDIRAWTYQQEGHVFVIFTGGGMETSLVFDLTTQVWHERAYFNEYGRYEPHLGICHLFAFGKNLVGSRRDGKIYEMSMDAFTDDGEEIRRTRVYTHLSSENQSQRFRELEVQFENGVGNADAPDPQCFLEISKDLARTWGASQQKSIGKVGEYLKKVVFRRINQAENLTFKLSISDPVKVVMIGSYLR